MLNRKLNIFITSLLNKVRKNKLFFQNLTYLSLLEGINILVPLITLPYLLRVLGKETYGLIIFAQAIIMYLAIFQNFGLNTLAIKEISIYRDNKEELNSIISNVFILKGLLFLSSLVILWMLVYFFPIFHEQRLLLFLTMWVCLVDFIFPKWYFQGIEKMKYITYVNAISKLVILILIFTIIKSQNDYLKLPIIYGIGALISGIFCMIIIFKHHKMKFVFSSVAKLIKLINESLTFFISDVSVSIFANSNKVIIGYFLGMTELAYYDLADKIIAVFRKTPLDIVRNAIYPRVAKTKDIKILHNISIIMGSYSILVIILIAIFAPLIVTLLGGKDMLESANVLRIFSISIFTTQISNYYITVGLWSLGYEKIFRNLMIYSTLVFLVLCVFFWFLGLINLYTLTAIPALVDIYLIIHTYFIYKNKKLI